MTTTSETCSFTWAGPPFLITYIFVSNWYVVFCFCVTIYSSACQFSLHYYWYCNNQKQSSSGVLQKRCSCKFRKIHEKTPALKAHFQWSCRSAEPNFVKKVIPAHMFSCEVSLNIFFKEPFWRLLCMNTRSVYCPTATFRLFKNDVTHIFGLSNFLA